ncbi:Pyridoxine 4-dehydrogenase [Commensalibacter sp. Nvir]|uniref:aldo/keto reductase n=1 Tax=Commensalibacter sp. Nvir TaxID=3069817 RepID=UPI002D3E4E5D|nr:Pyridoxine 4-dehydrogenase [Commensalibacter sp. Nvir]
MTESIDASFSGTFKIGGEIKVNRLGFGAMRITGKGVWGEPEDRNEAIATLKKTISLNINFIDTADSYGPFVSEDLICEALYPYPSTLLIGTKAGHTRLGPDIWRPIGNPNYLRQCVLMSMRRLKLNEIRFWQLHRVAEDTPPEVQFETIAKMQQEGLIRHVGLSAVGINMIKKAQQFFEVVSVQNRYNMLNRESEEVLNYCIEKNIAFISYAPLDQNTFEEGDVLKELMQEKNASARQIALAWLLKRSKVVIPIPGTSKVQHLKENVAAASLHLSDAEWFKLDKEGRAVWHARKANLKSTLRNE